MKTRTLRRVSSLWVLATLSLAACATPTQARVDTEPGHSIKVKFWDLNLATPSGTTELYRRIERAARRVCELDSGPMTAKRFYFRKQCEQTAIANAVRDVNNAALTAMYRQKNKLGPVG